MCSARVQHLLGANTPRARRTDDDFSAADETGRGAAASDVRACLCGTLSIGCSSTDAEATGGAR